MELLEKLKTELMASKAKQWVAQVDVLGDELVAHIKADDIVDLLSFLKTSGKFQFQILLSICAVDYPNRKDRFEVVYNLLSVTKNHRIRVKLQANTNTMVPSAIEVYSNAGWYEREAWDLYGVMFKNNPDLRRILTDYGFEGHPMRKDFPLSGHTEVRYNVAKKEVIYEKVSLTQEFRNFDFTSPWQGGDYVLPGDEKANS